jgi:hypothetical protein
VLATHATITTAISAIERSGAWKMEVRGNVEDQLNSLKQQLAALIEKNKNVPRPPNTVRAALAATRVPAGIWKDSRECAAIPESAHFGKECAGVVYLRTELNAAEDYERLSARANELRKSLAETPIMATSDPLPAAFAGTLGRLLPVGGMEEWRYCLLWWSRSSVALASPRSGHSTTRTLRLRRQGGTMCAPYQTLGMTQGGRNVASRKSSPILQNQSSLAPP